MGQNKRDLIGERFGKLIVVKEVKPTQFCAGKPLRRWQVRCDCGIVKEVNQLALTRKNKSTKSCGCTGKTKKYKTYSVLHYRKLYGVWCHMVIRCTRKTDSDYHKYGARGIKVCRRWLDFSHFYEDMAPTYKPGLTIERINVNGNYEPNNCTWIPNEDQAKNRRTTIWLENLCAKDFCKKHNKPYSLFVRLRSKNKSIQEIIDIIKA